MFYFGHSCSHKRNALQLAAFHYPYFLFSICELGIYFYTLSYIGCECKTSQSWGGRWTFYIQNQWWSGTTTLQVLYSLSILYYVYLMVLDVYWNWNFDQRNIPLRFMNGLEQVGNLMLQMMFKFSFTWWAPTFWKPCQPIRRYS